MSSEAFTAIMAWAVDLWITLALVHFALWLYRNPWRVLWVAAS